MREILIVNDYLKKTNKQTKTKKKLNLVFEFTVFIQIQSVIYINLFFSPPL